MDKLTTIEFENTQKEVSKKHADNNFQLNLVSLNTSEEIILSLNHTFPNKELYKDQILFKGLLDNKLIILLEEKGILTKGS